MSRYIDIEPYEKEGWYLQKHYHNSYGETMVTIPLISVPTTELNSCDYWDSESRFCALRRPQAEPVKHGRWIENDNGTYSCSECHSWIPNEQHYYAKYCLYCGAKMDLEEVRSE